MVQIRTIILQLQYINAYNAERKLHGKRPIPIQKSKLSGSEDDRNVSIRRRRKTKKERGVSGGSKNARKKKKNIVANQEKIKVKLEKGKCNETCIKELREQQMELEREMSSIIATASSKPKQKRSCNSKRNRRQQERIKKKKKKGIKANRSRPCNVLFASAT